MRLFDSPSVSWRLLRGASVGGAVACFAIGVGLLRAGFAVLRGTNVSFELDDVRMLATYVGGFVVAGMTVSAVWPALRRKRSRQAALALAGMIVAAAVVIGMEGLAVWTVPDWIIVLVLGPMFGLAFASGFLDSERRGRVGPGS
jgi:hypothetical protein